MSDGYARRFQEFADYFESEIEALGDETMRDELAVIKKLLAVSGSE